jgi:hypothetical protein
MLLVAFRSDNADGRVGHQEAPADAFEAIDLDFRAAYASGRAALLARLEPIIIVDEDRLVLVHRNKREEVTAIPPLYHRLKAVAHLPLAVWVSLAPYGDAPLDEARIDRLRRLRDRIDAVSKALETAGFDERQRARSQSLLDRSRELLSQVLETREYKQADLTAFTRTMAPLVLAHAADAARAEIDAYHARLSAWKAQMTAEDWARLRVLVIGRQMPRKHNVAVQYFAKLLKLPGESRRLVYAETLDGEQHALELLATHQLDSELSLAFFDDPDRMEIDLLGNAASVYLDAFDFGR